MKAIQLLDHHPSVSLFFRWLKTPNGSRWNHKILWMYSFTGASRRVCPNSLMNLCRTNPSFIEGVDRWVDLPIAGSSSQSFFRWNSYSWDEDNGEKHVPVKCSNSCQPHHPSKQEIIGFTPKRQLWETSKTSSHFLA